MDNTRKLCDLLKMHADAVIELNDTDQIMKEAQSAGNHGMIQYLESVQRQKLASLRDTVQNIRVRVKGRLLRSMIDNITLYEIKDYDERAGSVLLRLVFDPNGILIAQTNTNGNVIKNISGRWLEKHFFILPQDEEYEMRQRILAHEDCRIVVKYQVIDSEGEPLCLTNQILPEGLDMNQYEIKFEKSERRINDVIHKQYGCVQFDGQKIDQESTYVMGSRVTVFTSLIQKPFGNDIAEILNIIHIHLSDMSDYTSLDVVYLKKGETRQQHMEFGVDEMGTVLRYRLLIKNLAVHEILYNTGNSVEVVPF